MRFQWDSKKAAANLASHGISFAEASAVFGDPLASTIPDPEHSLEEARFLTLGQSTGRQLLVVSHADRGEDIRIISARQATRAEKRRYEEAEERHR